MIGILCRMAHSSGFQDMRITEIIRRNIIDDLRTSEIQWHGRLAEVDFLSRLYKLAELPSTDHRFANMIGDIHQHRINNDDWPDDWVYGDTRINLLRNDD